MRLFTFLLICLLLGCLKNSIAEVYYFENEFFTPIGLNCNEILETMGVSLLKIKQGDALSSMCETLDKYDYLIEAYSSGYILKITNGGKEYCSNLNILLKLTDEIPIKDLEVLNDLKRIIIENNEKSKILIPYDIRNQTN